MKLTTKAIGDFYENLAVAWVLIKGLKVVARNFHVSKVGEIDIIAEHEQMTVTGKQRQTLIFIEVRARKQGQFASSLESITPAKQRRIIQAAGHFLQQHPQFAHHDCRFDVIAFDGGAEDDTRQWIEAAFLAE